ncbi:NAD(P)H-binding protein [Cognatishimia activa]|uniref:NAD(P)H-binding protein n=1 Tax=Cognatishimia activa TaxID=1715691 RepID=UPI00222E0B5B|nr:NAD(P)H-binding protein [Cognatishimia activa]UZD90975.1 NAD(P)H-binding protein [Cognatishimia activa]
MTNASGKHVVILGATGAVGTEVMRELAVMDEIEKVTVLTRRPFTAVKSEKFDEHVVDPLDPDSYRHLLPNHDVAICTLGVGGVSSVSKDEFLRIDRDAVIAFGQAVKDAGAQHFQLLSSVGVSAKSRIFYLRSKGELENALRSMGFKRLSLFHPSNILTPANRYGIGQAIVLKVWPHLNPLLSGPLRRYRGIRVKTLGQSFARNCLVAGASEEVLEWDDFQDLTDG